MPQTVRLSGGPEQRGIRDAKPGDILVADGRTDDPYMVFKDMVTGQHKWLRLTEGVAYNPGVTVIWKILPPGTRVVLEM